MHARGGMVYPADDLVIRVRIALRQRAAYRERNRVERLIGRLKQYRRVATRYEKRASSYLAMLTLAGLLLWL